MNDRGQRQKRLFYYQFKIETSLSEKEVIEKIKQVTIPYRRPSIHIKLEDLFIHVNEFYFMVGKFDNKGFSCMPLPQKIPPYGTRNSWVPQVKGVVLNKEKTEIKIEVSATVIYWVFFLLINWALLICLLSGQINWGVAVLAGINIFNIVYFYIVAPKVKKLFEEILASEMN